MNKSKSCTILVRLELITECVIFYDLALELECILGKGFTIFPVVVACAWQKKSLVTKKKRDLMETRKCSHTLQENQSKRIILQSAHNPLSLEPFLQYWSSWTYLQYANIPPNQSQNVFIMSCEHLRCSWWVFCGCLMNHRTHMIRQTNIFGQIDDGAPITASQYNLTM